VPTALLWDSHLNGYGNEPQKCTVPGDLNEEEEMIPAEVKQEVKNLYTLFAETVMTRKSYPFNDSINYAFCRQRYRESELALVPPTALRLSCGCGNPVGFANIRPGCAVVDLGCGGGIDVVLAGHMVAEHGRVLGIDIAPAMVAGARQALAESGLAPHIFFRTADIEDIYPLPKNFADVVLANGVVTLCLDIRTVYSNVFRILRPGGVVIIADVILTEEIDPHLRARLLAGPSGYLDRAVAEAEHLLTLSKLSFDVLQVERTPFTLDELETIACYPNRDLIAPLSREVLELLQNKMAGVMIMARRRPLN
jgi:arsenite methyltransferase